MPNTPPYPNPESERARLEEEGFEALQRLYAEAVSYDAGQGGVCARLLLGLYNSYRFPFNLTELRTLPHSLFEDAMRVIRMDARLTRQEVHQYFSDGSSKFEELARVYDVQDLVRLQATGDGAPRPRAARGVLRHEDHVSATLITCGDAPGYRDVTLTLDCEVVGAERPTVGPVRLEVALGPADGERVMNHIRHVHALAWRDPACGPLDRAPWERPPPWMDPPASDA